ncbi:WXG100 family type VII secretion target [Kitasatospora saccharophila]|uniref:WXG100 family type VII secretion target n=2 Tax=Kitasatospora saccharophila TaxID=407973 RepID=A0ABP5J9A6_9ACTN
MTAFANRIGEVNNQVQGEISRLNNLVSEIASGWKGAAASAYQQMQSQFNDDATALNRILDEIRQAIEATTKAYSMTEEEQRAAVGGIG